MKKRALSIVLIVVLIMTLIPMGAFAAGFDWGGLIDDIFGSSAKVEITKQPTNLTVKAGDTATFTCEAESTDGDSSKLEYFWVDADVVDASNLSAFEILDLKNLVLEDSDGTGELSFTASVDHNGMHIRCIVVNINTNDFSNNAIGDFDVSNYLGKLYVASNVVTLTVNPAYDCGGSHDLVKTEAEPSYCREHGHTEYYRCAKCDQVFSDENGENLISINDTELPLDKDNHKLEKVEAVPATCEKDGNIEYWKCTLCRDKFSDENCSQKLTNKDIELESKDAPHQLTKIAANASTCTVKGNIEYYVCDVCGDYFNSTGETKYDKNDDINHGGVEKPLLEHNYKWVTDETSHYQKCTACDSIKSNSAGTHTGGNATCHDKAVCDVCGVNYGELDAENHVADYDNPKGATDTYTGDYYCKYHTDVLVEKGSEVCNHTRTHVEAVPATCQAEGVIEHWYCAKCDKYFADEAGEQRISKEDTADPILKHTILDNGGTMIPNPKVQDKDAPLGYNERGHYFACKFCGERVSGISTHQMNTHTADCSHGSLKCSICNYATTDYDSANHCGPFDYQNKKEATKTEAGYSGDKVCTACGTTIERGHETYMPCAKGCAGTLEKVPATEKTCTTDGIKEHWVCTKCGNEYMDANAKTPATSELLIDKCTGHELHPGLDALKSLTTDDVSKILSKIDWKNIKDMSFEQVIKEVGIADIDHCYNDTHHWLGCQRCGKTLRELQPELESKGITLSESLYQLSQKTEHSGGKATCQSKAVCSECGEHYGQLGEHRYDVVVTAPTCTKGGYTTHTCNICNKSYTDKVTAPVGHSIVNGKCSGCGLIFKNPFYDVDSTDEFCGPVLWAYYHEPQITNGTDETHFSPRNDCTRGQVVTFLWRAAGKPDPAGSCPFVDVDKASPFYTAITWAAEEGITTGFDATHFRPGDTVTRAQFVTFLWRFNGEPAATTTANPFTGDVSTSSVYYKAILWAAENGITQGYDATHFRPDTVCNRWQVVTFLYRAMVEPLK